MREWTPEILDAMSHSGDPLADATLEHAAWQSNVTGMSAVFRSLAADDAAMVSDTPPELLDFLARTRELPPGIDCARVARGAHVMLELGTLCALVLLLKSLPSGYASPRLSTVLHMTQNLERRPYLRALRVLQMLVDISQTDAFTAGGAAVVTAQRLRLLHAGVRRAVRASIPGFESRFGTALSQLDMTFTTMTFSVHVIDGLAALGVPLSDKDAGDYFYLWQMYGELQGIRREWMPLSVEEGRAFCRAYAREFRSAAENPQGVALTSACLQMMKGLIPWPLRLLGLGIAPSVYLLRLLGEEAAARVGVVPAGHRSREWLVMKLPLLWQRLWKTLMPEREAHHRLARLFFRSLIVHARFTGKSCPRERALQRVPIHGAGRKSDIQPAGVRAGTGRPRAQP